MFLGFDIAKSGLNVARKNMEVIAHNIANANTEGFSRQQAIASAKRVYSSSGASSMSNGVVGQGVEILNISRIRNTFLDEEYRMHSEGLGYYKTLSEAFRQIEVLFNEPNEGSVSSSFNNMWNSLSELSNMPDSLARRSAFMESTTNFTNTLNNFSDQLQQIKLSYDFELESVIGEINSIAREIDIANNEIKKVEMAGSEANDLRDQRDLLIDKLSKLVDTDSFIDERGVLNVMIGGRILVGGSTVKQLELRGNPVTQEKEAYWAGDAKKVSVNNGKLKAIMEVKNKVIPDLKAAMDEFVGRVADDFNTQHKLGYDLKGAAGIDFFVSKDGNPIGVDNIEINSAIIDDVSLIAASGNDVHLGDNENVMNLLSLRKDENLEISPGVKVGYDDYYRYIVSSSGIQARSTADLYEAKSNAVEMVQSQKEAVSGVSTDEEISNMVRYQQVYNSCAKMMSVLKEMLDTLVEI